MSMTVIDEIAAERSRQILDEGWDADHDDCHERGELARAAACYAISGGVTEPERDKNDMLLAAIQFVWPRSWAWKWWKPGAPRRDLIKAAALIVAEIERLDRAKAKEERK